MLQRGLIVVMLFASGCSTYEYDLVQPTDLARHVGKSDEVFLRDSIEYRLNSIENRLVLRAYNTTDQAMTLNGEKSVLVDETSQSHPLRSVTIAPKSFVKLILPPVPPRVERVGPSIGIGFGGTFGDARRARPYGWPHYAADGPQYFAIYDDGSYYWDWNKESDVRLTLHYEQAQTTIQHQFVIARKKQ